MTFYKWLGNLLPALIAFVWAWLGTRWGFSKYKKEKFWDATLKSYSNVLTSIEVISFFGLADKHQRVIYQGESGLIHDGEIFRVAIRELISTSNLQSMYFSSEFNRLVRGFISEAYGISSVDFEELEGRTRMVLEAFITDIQRHSKLLH